MAPTSLNTCSELALFCSCDCLNDAAEITLTRDLIGGDIPRYAMLSHTCRKDEGEVTLMT